MQYLHFRLSPFLPGCELSLMISNEQVGRLLVTTDLTKSDGSGTVTVGLLHTSSGGGRFTGSLCGKLLTGSFSSGGFTSGLLGTGHVVFRVLLIVLGTLSLLFIMGAKAELPIFRRAVNW